VYHRDIIQKYKFELNLENNLNINWFTKPQGSEQCVGHSGHLRRKTVRCCNPKHKFFGHVQNVISDQSSQIS
ncbi:hypothetical protein BpHYR1_023574, partial [Brachionus plicatilis]